MKNAFGVAIANIPSLCLFGAALWLISTDHPWWAAAFLFAGYITVHSIQRIDQ